MNLSGSATRLRGIVTAIACLVACAQPTSFARLTIDVSVAGLAPDQLALLATIDIRSTPGQNSDPSLVRVTSVPVLALDGHAYHESYLPDPQTGSVVVSASLFDAQGREIGSKSETVQLVPASVAHVTLDFVSSVPTGGPLRVERAPVMITEGDAGTSSFAFLWDTDHYLIVFNDASKGGGDLVSARYDAAGTRISDYAQISSSQSPSILPSLVKVSDGYVVAWQEGPSNTGVPTSVQIRKLDANGIGVGNIRRIASQSQEARPVLQTAAGQLAITWTDREFFGNAAYVVARMALLEPAEYNFLAGPVNLASSPVAVDATFPVVAATDSGLSVSWIEGGTTVQFADMNESLQMSNVFALDTSPYTAQQLASASDGSNVYVAWEKLSGDVATGRERIYGSYADTGGTAGPNGYVNELYTGSANWPRIAWSAKGGVVVVYYQYRDFGSQIFMTRLSAAGERLDAADVELTNVAGQAKYPDIHAAGTDGQGEHFGVGWIDDHTGVQRMYFETVVVE
jgi:hypothetical protein